MYSGVIRDWPKRVRFGAGSIRELPGLLEEIGARRAAIVCGQSVAGGRILPAGEQRELEPALFPGAELALQLRGWSALRLRGCARKRRSRALRRATRRT